MPVLLWSNNNANGLLREMYQYDRELLLIAPDNEQTQGWAGHLRANRWEVRFARDKNQVALALKNGDPAVILVDCLNSRILEDNDLLTLYQKSAEGPAVVAILAKAGVDDVLRLIRQGASDVLLQPFSNDDLLAVIENALKLKQVVREKQRYRDQLEKTNLELQESLNILRQDQLAGRQVQQSMLPKTPQRHHGYVIAHHIVPSLYLSGDFVGYHVLLDRYLIFYFADVSGHGASSAFVTVLLRFMLNRIIRKHVIRRDEDNLERAPQGLAESLNRQLIATKLDKHMTLFAGAIDMKKHRLRYVIGAQMPAPILVENGSARLLPGKGKPVGIFENAVWDVQEMELPEKFSLCVVSDGVFDFISGSSLVDKEQKILKAVASHGHSLSAIRESLGLSNVQEAPDDISLLFVSRGLS